VTLPEGGAAALQAQRLVPDARVVAALHHVSSVHLSEAGRAMHGDVLVCTDDAHARDVVLRLIGDLGMRGLDAGPLANAVALEAMTPVLLYMNKKYKRQGLGLAIAGLDG
jgi:predicted dinucleotide-binding enzyme